ncbi:hypothetical protein A3G63_03580 [Candidatus Kaiserbacteria bacterium RIFCSPLOWO2_12_FULL_52_8]|uniref:Type II secretion system protein GspG C-terminal domain-containing protein n=1 Tax=Candidatus Kaiserbacteria bacterium RIFCSPHIGHO2_01_FULL_53_31 TaxID=1798481 RepID=A0A1F6CGI3_9BACT|nr:MAG: hypothetical protein A2678_00265 [Candidatus Kaiserbacteria bacterium RIFCSPHIGHO2_01_FULL_53_31]OGG93923.1 MAG: hypothetical protein A3G63_03580 [Candidatus Kaiserbacteria bacterium RIFCSPLOWO2_12_FULL_52_8]
MNKNRSQGFTLIELLVVIAIIGVLSAVVLASMNTARSKGQDAAIQSDITGIKTQAEIYRTDNSMYSSGLAADTTGCTTADTLFADATIAKQIAAADEVNGTAGVVTCNVSEDGTAYAVAAQLVANTSAYFCVDSTGTATTTTTALATSPVATACP